jgi:uncharacterized protein with HEPN domain
MRDAARQAMRYCAGRAREDLSEDEMLSLSLIRLLEVIGEAARGLSASLCEKHPEVAWNRIVGIRNRLIHGYFDVNLDVVWQTVREDLAPLVARLDSIIVQETQPNQ